MHFWIRKAFFLLFSASLLVASIVASEVNATHSDAISVKQSLDRLCVTGSVLMIAAHPDDENTALISYLARGRNVRMAYLSLTRGEGGQNAIGSETGPVLGVIRTQELLESRRIDGAQQFFTRAIDFGFSKNPKETIERWDHDAVLGDIVWVIRKFRPDVVILQFTGTPRDGHGQHQASAILGREAFTVAADSTRYVEQLKYVRPWKAKRLMMNRRGFTPEMQKEIAGLSGKLDLDLGGYSPLLGYSYGELAGISRSYNRTQSEGTPRVRGVNRTTLVTVEGPVANTDLFDGIDLSWNRFKGGAEAGELLRDAVAKWNPEHPDELIPQLVQVEALVKKIDDPDAQAKLKEIDETIARCAGLWLDFTASAGDLVSGKPVTLRVSMVRRTAAPVKLISLAVNGAPFKGGQDVVLDQNVIRTLEDKRTIEGGETYTQPYWLLRPPQHDRYFVDDVRMTGLPQGPAPLNLTAVVHIGDATVTLDRPVLYRYVDRLQGETITPVAYLPPVSLRIVQPTLVFAKPGSKAVQVEVKGHVAGARGSVKLKVPPGWQLNPQSQQFALSAAGEQQMLTFNLDPGPKAESGTALASLETDGKVVDVSVYRISYPHIPLETLFPKADARLVRTDATTLAKRVGYVMGSGDEMPDALRQLGTDVTLLEANDLARGNLSQFDAIVTGIRAYTQRPDLVANQPRLLEYVAHGGTLIVQYNRNERNAPQMTEHLGPYPFEIGNGRVTVEDVPVTFESKSRLLTEPNKITESDFADWVQERGLYFASKWDSRYSALFETHDPGEAPLRGGTLVAHYGKGTYIFTAFAWFRELPAGVPGAYRIFANFLSASKTLAGEASANRPKANATAAGQ